MRYWALGVGLLVGAAACGAADGGETTETTGATTGAAQSAEVLPCERARAWVDEHGFALPSTYDDFARLDRYTWLAAFNAVTPEVRAGVARTRLDRFAGRALTREQRAFLDAAKALAVPEMFDGTDNSAMEQILDSRARAVFSAEELAALDTMDEPVVIESSPTRCNCNTTAQDCKAWGLRCIQGVSPCDNWPDGCGRWLPFSPCDGLCLGGHR